MPAIGAGDAAIHDLCAAEPGLQRQHSTTNVLAVGGDHLLEHHALGPGELATHRGEVFAKGRGREPWCQLAGIRLGEEIRQCPGQEINHLPLPAHLDAIQDAAEVRVG